MSEHRPIRYAKRAMEEALAWRVLEKCVSVTFSLADGAGNPYGVVLSHAMVGKSLYVHCARQGHKLELLGENPRVCLTSVLCQRPRADFDVDYISVTAFGTAAQVSDSEEMRRALVAICAKNSPGMDPEETLKMDTPRVTVLRVDIDAITGKAFWPEPVEAVLDRV